MRDRHNWNVPILSVDEFTRSPLGSGWQRILVAGTSGSGKTTLAARIGRTLGIEHVEIDALFHGPNWTPRPSFVDDVDAFTARPSWVTEWQYPAVRAMLAERADLVVWLDLPRRVVMRQVISRTLRRWVRREQLWNGNVEQPLHTIFTDRDHIVRWAWSTHDVNRVRVEGLVDQHPDLVIVRVGSRREAAALVDSLRARPVRSRGQGIRGGGAQLDPLTVPGDDLHRGQRRRTASPGSGLCGWLRYSATRRISRNRLGGLRNQPRRSQPIAGRPVPQVNPDTHATPIRQLG